MTGFAFQWTARVLLFCCAPVLLRLILGPRGADRLAALSVLSALVLALLVLFGVQDGRALYLDVALVYDVFGFLGILAIASLLRDRSAESGSPK